MERRCHECMMGRHALCIDVNCCCFTCLADDKEQQPISYPVAVVWLPTCGLQSS